MGARVGRQPRVVCSPLGDLGLPRLTCIDSTRPGVWLLLLLVFLHLFIFFSPLHSPFSISSVYPLLPLHTTLPSPQRAPRMRGALWETSYIWVIFGLLLVQWPLKYVKYLDTKPGQMGLSSTSSIPQRRECIFYRPLGPMLCTGDPFPFVLGVSYEIQVRPHCGCHFI